MAWICVQSSPVRRQVPAGALRVPRVCFYGAFHTLSPRRGSSGPLCTQLPSPHRPPAHVGAWRSRQDKRQSLTGHATMQRKEPVHSPGKWQRTDLSLGGGEGLRRLCARVKPGQGLALGEH